MKHFIITDITDGINSPIGVIQNIPRTEIGIESFNERMKEAISDHLDSSDFNIDIVSIEDIFDYKPKEVSIEIDGCNYFIEIQEVFFF